MLLGALLAVCVGLLCVGTGYLLVRLGAEYIKCCNE